MSRLSRAIVRKSILSWAKNSHYLNSRHGIIWRLAIWLRNRRTADIFLIPALSVQTIIISIAVLVERIFGTYKPSLSEPSINAWAAPSVDGTVMRYSASEDKIATANGEL